MFTGSAKKGPTAKGNLAIIDTVHLEDGKRRSHMIHALVPSTRYRAATVDTDPRGTALWEMLVGLAERPVY